MPEMRYEIMLAMLGFGILGAAIAPALLRRTGWRIPVSLPMTCLGGGILVGMVFQMPRIDVIAHGVIIQRVTEMAVILSLAGCGLKLDRPLGLRGWGSTWRLLGITMPLSIALGALAAGMIVGLPAAVALLFAAAMAPTDPVLAASVQVGPPGEETEEDEVRFALTSEAGLNDGLAFPFIHLALAAAAAYAARTAVPGDTGEFSEHVLSGWLAADVAWKITAGVGMGALIGWLLGWLVFRLAPARGVADAFLAIGLTLFAYGMTEVVHGYGFIAVFVAALTFRRFEREHEFHSELHHFIEQTEALFLIAVLFATGIAIAQGALAPLGWQGLLVAVLSLVVIRPIAGWAGFVGSSVTVEERMAMSVLGIRGIGSFYYLAYGLTHAPFSIDSGRQLWAMAILMVALSVVLHGLSAEPIIRRTQIADRLRRRAERRAARRSGAGATAAAAPEGRR